MITGFSLEQWLATGVAALVFGALGYVLRFIIERSHAREMEALRATNSKELEAVRASYSQELEHLRSQLGQRAIQFSKLHQDRVQHVITIYDSLLELQSEIHTYLIIIQHGTAENKQQARSEAYDNVIVKLRKAWIAYRHRRFYFDKKMEATIEAVFKPLYDIEQVTFGWHQSSVTTFDPGYDLNTRENFKRDLAEAQSLKREALRDALDALEESMREMLGVEGQQVNPRPANVAP